jgi:hypothetical protein
MDIGSVPIKEQSFLARIAAYRLGKVPVAMVWGNKILLYGVSKADFLKDRRWVRHEMEHIRQFRHYGFLRFLILYAWESIRKGYDNNRFELAAREAEGK